MEKLLALAAGRTLPASGLKGDWFREMLQEGILTVIRHGSRQSYRAVSAGALRSFVKDNYNIGSLEACRDSLSGREHSRAALVQQTGDSKFIFRRTFRGFLINSYEVIDARLHNRPFRIRPVEGAYTFIYDYTSFSVPENVIIVGVENSENFQYISRQRPFFNKEIAGDVPLLFVSRYPQNGDLVRWLASVSNRYVHFGDLDLAGINIFQTEFYKQLGDRASFLIPDDYEIRLKNGSPQRYNVQLQKFRNMPVLDKRIVSLLECIHRYHRGYDQEGFIDAEDRNG